MAACFGWAAGIALGVWVSGGISGGHINPAVGLCISKPVKNLKPLDQVTLAMAVFRGFPWKKVPVRVKAFVALKRFI